jgi:CheY-like chemotaxis protein
MLEGLRVLVVEDERGVRLLLSRILADAGAAVTAVGSQHEALEAFRRAPPDVLVSDIRMPGGSGFDLIREVRALPAERGGRCPAIAVSASVDEAEVPRILAAGFQRFVRKPFDAGDLRTAIADVTGRPRA